MKMTFRISALSDVGLVRKNNEDNLFVPGWPLKNKSDSYYERYDGFSADRAFICVYDGMGGHSSGEVASYMAASEVKARYRRFVNRDVKNKKNITSRMNKLISQTNDEIYYSAESNPDLHTMGTTLTGIYFLNGCAYYVNIGDSRSYVLNGRKLIQLSNDHADPMTKNALTRFLGMSSEYGNVVPDVAFVPSKIGTSRRYLLCSDGLTDMLDDKSIERILLEYNDGMDAANQLIDEAKKRGGRDNITAVIIDVKPKSKIARAAKNRVLTGCIAAALILGAAGTAAYKFKPEPHPGTSISEMKNEIKNAENFRELKDAIDNGIKAEVANKDDLKYYCTTVDESDSEVQRANENLKNSIDDYRNKIMAFRDEFNNIVDSDKEDDEKYNELQTLSKDNLMTEMVNAGEECEKKKQEVENALDAWQARQDEEDEKQKQSETSG
ncbi:MAG: protein phosphatase 2C domain-containing protein, partial [Oscillospiraceae bacterium]|nr:protein phosphatase 2C domain-containing protein [Oscillospiraceae bacterium]